MNTDQDPAGAPSQILTLGGRALPTWALRPLGFLLISVLMSWPLARTPGDAILGYSTIDAVDTVMLRGLVADLLLHPSSFPQSLGVYFPIGFPVLELTPNLLDHLSAAPFVWIFGFPWGDNLWWLCVLTLNGLAAHALGRKVGGSEGAGWLAGVAFQLAEPVAREANLHHAPQAMLFAAPLYVLALLELHAKPSRQGAMTAGAWGLQGQVQLRVQRPETVGTGPVPGLPRDGCRAHDRLERALRLPHPRALQAIGRRGHPAPRPLQPAPQVQVALKQLQQHHPALRLHQRLQLRVGQLTGLIAGQLLPELEERRLCLREGRERRAGIR